MKYTFGDVVISGVAGSFPESVNIAEFEKNLNAGISLVSENTEEIKMKDWLPINHGIGQIPRKYLFDNQYFGMSFYTTKSLDPLYRLCLQIGVDAICDAGVNPTELSGTATGVFGTSGISDSDSAMSFDYKGSRLLGNARTMLANRLSFYLNLKGPSFSIQSSWAGVFDAINYAATAIAQGRMEAALIVAGGIVSSMTSMSNHELMGKLNIDNCTKCFSDEADGYSRAECCVAFFIQKSENARRSYGKLVGMTQVYQGSKNEMMMEVPKGQYSPLLKKLYADCEVDPSTVAYVEASGLASKVVDAVELNSLAEVMLGPERSKPLLVGSVKSNAGHAEGAADGMALAKVIIIANSGRIPPNINFSKPNSLVPALLDGKMKVVTDSTPLESDLIGLNCVCFSGSLRHLILERHPATKKYVPTEPRVLPPDGLPRLFIISGRNEDTLLTLLNEVEEMPIDPDFIALSHRVFSTGIRNHVYRAFTILTDDEKTTREINHYFTGVTEPPPLWFVFTGMGSQWTGMGNALMKLPTFAKAIHRCHEVLKPKGLDLINIITTEDSSVFDNILHSFVGIAAIQIGLVDVLFEIGLVPDGMIGHSVGEMACAYADGCFTAEQMILSAYCRGMASVNCDLIPGMMAAVGMGYQQIKDMLPEDIDVACHNSFNSSTLSGPVESMTKFVNELKEKNVFCKLVNVSNIAYHSRYIKPAAAALLQSLKEVIPFPKPRSKKWVSTSVPESEWDSELAQYSSPEYHANNQQSPVLFEEASVHVPQNAIIIEVSPHGLLQAILKRSFPNAHNIPLTDRSSPNNLIFFLTALGRAYGQGLSINLDKLYPPVEYPVARGTPSLGHFVNWELTEMSKEEIKFGDEESTGSYKNVKMDFEKEWKNVSEFNLDGSSVVPISAFLKFSLDELLKQNSNEEKEQSIQYVEMGYIEFNDFLKIEDGAVTFFTGLSGKFHAYVDDTLVVSCYINQAFEENKSERVPDFSGTSISSDMFYDSLTYLGLYIGQPMRLVKSVVYSDQGVKAVIHWNGDLTCFMESALLLPVFAHGNCNTLYAVTKILKICLDLYAFDSSQPRDISVIYESNSNQIQCDGLTILQPTLTPVLHKENYHGMFLRPQFINYSEPIVKDLPDFLKHVKDIVVENVKGIFNIGSTLHILEIMQDMDIRHEIIDSFKYAQGVNVNIKLFREDSFLPDVEESNIVNNNYLVVSKGNNLEKTSNYLKFSNQGYVLIQNDQVPSFLDVITSKRIEGQLYSLCTYAFRESSSIFITTNKADWVTQLQKQLDENKGKFVYLVHPSVSLGEISCYLHKCRDLRNSHQIRYIFHDQGQSFNPLAYKKQFKMGLKINVFIQGSSRTIALKKADLDHTPNELLQVPSYRFSDIRTADRKVNSLGLLFPKTGTKCQKIGVVGYSGVRNKKKLCGIGELNEFTQVLTPDPIYEWEKPENWTDDEIATVILPYAMAFYVFKLFSNKFSYVTACKSILVHRGSLLISQAVINIALRDKCEVCTTYQDQEERKLIRSLFPQIPEGNIISSELVKSVDPFKKFLAGKGLSGFTIITNTSDDSSLLSPLLSLLEVKGLLFHLGSPGDARTVGMRNFMNEITIYGLNTSMFTELNVSMKEYLRDAFSHGLKNGHIKPLPYSELPWEATTAAALKLNMGRNFPGNLVISSTATQGKCDDIKEFDGVTLIIDKSKNYSWLGILDWLVKRGAKKIKLIIDSDKQDNYAAHKISCTLNEFPDIHIELKNSAEMESGDRFKDWLHGIKKKDTISLILFVGNISNSMFSAVHEETSDSRALYLTSRLNDYFMNNLKKGTQVINKKQDLALPHKIFLVLDGLMKTTDRFLFYDENMSKNTAIGEDLTQMMLSQHMPVTVDEVAFLACQPHSSYWKEVRTQSPRAELNKDSVPIFLIPSLKKGSLNSLIKKLFSPAFIAEIPRNMSVEQISHQLYKDFLRFNTKVFTLICSDWSWELGIILCKIMEANNRTITLIVFDSCLDLEAGDVFFTTEKQVLLELKDSQVSQTKEKSIRTGLEVLKERLHLTSTDTTQLSARKLKGLVALVRARGMSSDNSLYKRIKTHTESPVNLVTANEPTYIDMVKSESTVRMVNILTRYDWKDAAREVPRPNDINIMKHTGLDLEIKCLA